MKRIMSLFLCLIALLMAGMPKSAMAAEQEEHAG